MKWIKKNWPVYIGIMIGLYYLVAPSVIPFTGNDLEEITIIAKTGMSTTGGRYTSHVYAIRAYNYPAIFVLGSPVNFCCDREKIKNTIRGDTLAIKISSTDNKLLTDPSAEIFFYGMQRNGMTIFDTDAYETGIKKKNRRLKVVAGIGIFLLLLLNINIPKKRFYYIAWAIMVIVFFILVEKRWL